MAEAEKLFALVDQDDAAGLAAAVGERSASGLVNENGESLYLYATYRGHTKCAELLAGRGGLSLHEAAAAGALARVDACLDAAPWAVTTLSADGWTALHLAAFLGRDVTVERLLERGANPRQWGRAADSNLAMHAASAGRRIGRGAFAKLVAATRDPDIPQKAGYTALMIAAANGFSDAADALMAAGADRARKTPDGRTAADFARERGHGEIARRLS